MLGKRKRCGRIQKLNAEHYLFVAEVQDAEELLPWLRSFIGHIDSFTSTNKNAEVKFWQDLQNVYTMYGLDKVGGADEHSVQ